MEILPVSGSMSGRVMKPWLMFSQRCSATVPRKMRRLPSFSWLVYNSPLSQDSRYRLQLNSLSSRRSWETLFCRRTRISESVSLQRGMQKSALYRILKARGQPEDQRASFIWKNFAPPRVQLFMWLLINKRIQCRTNLLRKGIVDGSTCEVCNDADETTEHIISGCSLAREVWQRLNMPNLLSVDLNSIHNLSPPQGSVPVDNFSAFLALVSWQLWKARNNAIFRHEQTSLSQFLAACKASAELWRFRLPISKRSIPDTWCSFFHQARQGIG